MKPLENLAFAVELLRLSNVTHVQGTTIAEPAFCYGYTTQQKDFVVSCKNNNWSIAETLERFNYMRFQDTIQFGRELYRRYALMPKGLYCYFTGEPYEDDNPF